VDGLMLHCWCDAMCTRAAGTHRSVLRAARPQRVTPVQPRRVALSRRRSTPNLVAGGRLHRSDDRIQHRGTPCMSVGDVFLPS
jgi:hypothetical protein